MTFSNHQKSIHLELHPLFAFDMYYFLLGFPNSLTRQEGLVVSAVLLYKLAQTSLGTARFRAEL